MKRSTLWTLIAALGTSAAFAGEHAKEHATQMPETQTQAPVAAPVAAAPAPAPASPAAMSPKDVKKFFTKVVQDDVKAESAKSGGAFKVHDDVLNKDWGLKLVRIHTQKIVGLGGGKYFACADFKEAAGAKTPVDLDFYVAKAGDDWKVEQVLVHKVDGKMRFTYNDKNERVPVAK